MFFTHGHSIAAEPQRLALPDATRRCNCRRLVKCSGFNDLKAVTAYRTGIACQAGRFAGAEDCPGTYCTTHVGKGDSVAWSVTVLWQRALSLQPIAASVRYGGEVSRCPSGE
jgi:hypothetical protein